MKGEKTKFPSSCSLIHSLFPFHSPYTKSQVQETASNTSDLDGNHWKRTHTSRIHSPQKRRRWARPNKLPIVGFFHLLLLTKSMWFDLESPESPYFSKQRIYWYREFSLLGLPFTPQKKILLPRSVWNVALPFREWQRFLEVPDLPTWLRTKQAALELVGGFGHF